MTRLRLLRSILIALCVAAAAPAQPTAEFRRVFASDSLEAEQAQTSPDGRWVVFTVYNGELTSSIWIASTNGGSPIRLTSGNYNDTQPWWFSSGDRIAFASTRPNRNGGRQQYVMTLGIDPATGRGVGTPRQVSSEPATRVLAPSRDGRWVPYVSAGAAPELKIVPANGGMARTLTKVTPPLFGVFFSQDGRFLFYTDQVGTSGPPCGVARCTFTIRRVSIDGGAPQVVAAEDHPIGVLPADPRYVGHRLTDPSGTGVTFELRELGGRIVGRAQLPRGMRQSVTTGDGFGITGILSDNGSSVRVATVGGGPVKILTANSGHWAEAWMADGSAVIADRLVGERLVVDALPLTGGERRQATLPAGALGSGWQTNLGPWFSYQTRSPDALHAISLATGQTRSISRVLEARIGVRGRGGQAQDGSRWIYAERAGNRIEFRSADPASGASESIRAFPDGRGQRNDFMIHGTRLAWFEARGDSVDLLLSDGPAAAVRRLASFHTTEVGDEERDAWSWKGDRIAVCAGRSGPVRANLLSIFTLSAGNAAPARQDYEIGTASRCWAPQWLPDDSGVVFLAIMDRRENVPDLMHFALREGTRPAVLTGDDPHEIWEFTLSPDGRFAAYTVSLPGTNSSVHVASFKVAIEGRR